MDWERRASLPLLLARPLPGKPMIPDALLLRDSLYLLQGIDGRFVKFTIPIEEPNPYRRPELDPDAEVEPFRLTFEDDPKVSHDSLTASSADDSLSSTRLD